MYKAGEILHVVYCRLCIGEPPYLHQVNHAELCGIIVEARSRVWWHMIIIPVTPEAEAVGLQVEGLPQHLRKTLSQKVKCSDVLWRYTTPGFNPQWPPPRKKKKAQIFILSLLRLGTWPESLNLILCNWKQLFNLMSLESIPICYWMNYKHIL